MIMNLDKPHQVVCLIAARVCRFVPPAIPPLAVGTQGFRQSTDLMASGVGSGVAKLSGVNVETCGGSSIFQSRLSGQSPPWVPTTVVRRN
jgi:hypothetical protein